MMTLLSSGICERKTTLEACNSGSVTPRMAQLGAVLSMGLWDCPSWVETQFLGCDLLFIEA